MPVSTVHPSYGTHLPQWTKTRDAVSGSRAVKSKKHVYLPVPDNNTDDASKGADSVRYKQYIKRALYTNFTGRTKSALVGAAFRKAPIIELPAQIDYLEEDATGDGLSMQQLCKDELGNLLDVGRTAFLVDYPAADEGLSIEQVEALELRASIVPYTAEQVTNWKTSSLNGRKTIVLVTLAEAYIQSDDEFGHESKTQHRVLRLRDDGYTQQVYREDVPFTEEVYPTKNDGSRWLEIPFTFAGSKNNDCSVDDAPMADIAEVNISHYRNSADYEESCFLSGQPTLFLTTSMNSDAWKEANPNGIVLGSRAGHVLGETGSAIMLQAEANNLVGEAMKNKEAQIVMIGARIITDRGGQETAEGARIRFASENSVLGDVVNNLSDAINKCIYWVCEFMGVESEYTFKLNTEFYDRSVDPQMIMAMVTLLDRGLIAEEDVFDRVKAGGLIAEERTFEDVQDARGLANPLI